jgi:5-methylcytosine-specific restriction endonuclease McrA
MQKHTRTYFKYFGYGIDSIIICEICGKDKSVDIHYIDGRIGKQANNIENLIACCRKCHNAAHDGKITKEVLHIIHNLNLKK